MKEPIFIGGQMKSGTTLLRMLLGRHSSIFTGLETFWFLDDVSQEFYKKNEKIIRIQKFYELTDKELDFIIKETLNNKKHFISNLFDYLTKKENKNRWLEKTPDNLIYLDKMEKFFKKFKFIHIVRDYRDIYSSWKTSNKYDLDYFINKVKNSYKKYLPFKNKDFILEIKYEDLVLDTKNTMQNVLEFLNEKFEEVCLEIDVENSKKEFKKVYEITGKKSNTLISTQNPIFSFKVGQYKTILTKEEIHKIEKELKEFFELYGYTI